MTRLLIAYDGSHAARAAMALAGALFGGAETLVAAVCMPAPNRVGGAAIAADGAELARAAGLNAAPRALAGEKAWRTLRAFARAIDA
jgi:hypothetical protein